MRRAAPGPDGQAIVLSGRLFQRLLAAYPRAHRRDYGPAMTQLFRDQCRDAWRVGRGWGLTWLWLRVLPDLVKTSVMEHISTLRERKAMLDRIGSLLRPRSAPLVVFAAVFAVVFLFVVAAATIVTFILPESYSSTARIKVERGPADTNEPAGRGSSISYDPYFIQTEFEVIQSEVILGKVIEALDLNTVWGKKYAGGIRLKTAESLTLLKSRLDLRTVRNTSLIEIRVYSEQPDEAAKLANAIADAFRDHRQTQQRLLAQGAAQAAEQEIKQQADRVAALQTKAAQLRKELNVPSPEPPPDDLLAKYRPYWEAKREADVANRFLDELSMKNEAARLQPVLPQTLLVEIVDRAVPGLRPVRPNKPANIAFGVLGGGFLATVVGGVMAWITACIGRRSRGTGAPPGTGAAPPPNLPRAESQPLQRTLDRVVGVLWMGVGGLLSGVALAGLFWFFIMQQASMTPESLLLPIFGLCWGGNVVLGFHLRRGKRWARVCLGTEGVLFLIYFCFRHGLGLPHCLAWLSVVIFKLGTLLVGVVPYAQLVYLPLGIASVCVLLWPRKRIVPSLC